MRRLALSLAAILVGAQAEAALTTARLTVTPTPSGKIDTRYRDGDDGTTAIPLSWGTCPTITLTNGGSCTTNLRTACNLVEAGSPTSTLSLLSGSLPSGCSISGDGITGTVGGTGTSSVVVRATRNTDTADTAAFTVQALSGGSDTTAPTIPFGLTATDNLDGTGTLTWEQSGDPTVSSVATGVASYQVKLGGSALATVTAPAANVIPALTAYEVGSDTGEASSQSGANWSLTYSGGGLLATTDGIYGRWAPITGDYTAIAKITSYTPTSGTAGSVGIAARASNSAAGSIAVYSRWRDTDDKCNQRQRTSTDGTATNGTLSSAYTLPTWVMQTRVGDIFTTACSSDGNTFTTTSSSTIAAGPTVYVGPFITSGSAGNAATAAVDQFVVQQSGTVSYAYTGAGGSFSVNAYDGTNRSSDSAAVTLTPTGGAGGGGSGPTIPAATHTVCNSGCDYTPSQLATTAISQRVAGDVLELRTATAGGTEEWAARIVCSSVSGTSADPIWIVVRDGDHITLDTTTASANAGLVDANACNYWNVVGSRDGESVDGLEIGDETWHTAQCGQLETGAGYGCYPNAKSLYLISSTGWAFYGVTIRGGNDYEAALVDKNSSRVLFKNVEWAYDGHNAYDQNKNGTIDNSGDTDSKDIAHICSSYTVLEDVYAHHSGHATPIPCGPYQVWRRFTGDGNWLDKTTTSRFTGNHAGIFLPGAFRSDYNTTTRFGPLIEDSLFYGVGSEPEHKNFQETVQIQGLNTIFRQNYIVQRAGTNPSLGRISPQWLNSCASNTSQAGVLRIGYLQAYNNTSWGGFVLNNSGSIGGSTTGHPDDTCAGYKVKNNLFQGMQTGTNTNGAAQYTVRWVGPGGFTGHSNYWKSAEWFGNIFGLHPTDPASATYYRVNVSGTGGSGAGTQDLTAGVDTDNDKVCTDESAGNQGLWPSNWCGNLSAQLTFAGGSVTPVTNDYNDQSIDRETLRGLLTLSPSATYGIGDAWPMTYVASADSGSGTTLVLENARWIYDGWDIDEYDWGGLHQEYPDCIAIGATVGATAASATVVQVATATDINYSTGTVTLASGVTRVDGAPVWPATRNADGTCGAVWDNRGAAQ